jgi:mRNA-degrading endonuclease toxin of MazEF toxin-antitoxin module
MTSKGSDIAARMRGHAARALGAERPVILAGEVYIVDDAELNLPSDAPRRTHPKRHVIVLQSENATAVPEQRTVLVAPCSASRMPGPFDHEFETENGFAERDIAVFVSLVQPFLKSKLTARQGRVSSATLDILLTRVAGILGLATGAELAQDGSRSEGAPTA